MNAYPVQRQVWEHPMEIGPKDYTTVTQLNIAKSGFCSGEVTCFLTHVGTAQYLYMETQDNDNFPYL